MKLSVRRCHFLLLTIAFVVSLLFRLPTLNRPLSKHHEFNTAVILNGIISWKEAGGASVFHYVPLMTYQGSQNRVLQRGPYTDDLGNHWYLSLGPGWYVLPYVVFTTFHLPFTPLSLQILNLCLHLLTIFALYRLCAVVVKKYTFLSAYFPLVTCLVFLFMPGPLWFFGNGYVHAAVSLPFALALFTQYLRYVFYQQKFSFAYLIAFLLLGIAGIYFDWFTFFLLFFLSMYSLFLFIKKKDAYYFKLALLCGATALVGVVLIFCQLVSLAGVQKVVGYWTSRASDRSFTVGEVSFFTRVISLLSNLVTCAGISVLVMIAALIIIPVKKKEAPLLPILLWLLTCICYNGVFFNWSYEHEFSMVPVSIGISLVVAYAILHIVPPGAKPSWLLAMLCSINVVQYYFVNPPGKIARAGTPYNQQQLLGESISRQILPQYRIFSNLNNDPIVEFYAHRSFVLNRAATAAEAKRISDSLNIHKAVWLHIDSLQIKEMEWVK